MSTLDALQTVLADEHAALYTYGVLGARTSQTATPALYAALTAGYRRHRARRDQLRILVEAAGAEPAAAAPAYELDGRLLRPPQLQAAALTIEAESAQSLLALVAQSSGDVREWALTEATWSASWQLELGGSAQTWPGAPELD
ncbi:DUF4439 domain-containing protein [Nocardioides hwasunensis]|uniref:DUF4439 domain-containing protein n=1 Tax=Nocardioides hwasunensis TaxID=397258 RepID=A0ABR8MDP0_9ACTN|nr:DUF4439 domain-containing protein [Nocardioides hwasunensis]MBD3913321.1 DUF4439 domain-containing protein [Nocardioides hwasunensis]